MSNVSEIQFAVEKSVLDIGVKIVFLVIEGIDNTRISPEWMEKRKGIIANLLNDYKYDETEGSTVVMKLR